MVEGFADTQTAREAIRVLTRPKTEILEIKKVFSRLFVTDMDICLMSLRLILENFDNLVEISRDPTFKLTEFVFSRTADISRIIPPLSLLVGSREAEVRQRAVELICSVGPLAKPAEDLAMGCLRNNLRDIRLCGAKILYSTGAACSRSLVRQLRVYLDRMKQDEEFCNLIGGAIKRIESASSSESSRVVRRESAAIAKLLAGTKVMVVDDNQTLRETLDEMLRDQYSMTVLQASDGAEAMDLISMQEADGIDFVILDLKMPEANGIRVLQYIREESPIKNAKVIMATAVADERIVASANRFGISSYLRKPFRINQLIKIMLENHPKVTAALSIDSA